MWQRNPLLGQGFRAISTCLLAILITVILPLNDSRAERGDRLVLARSLSPLLLEVQTALSHLGFCNGSADGQFMIATGHAIRRYRRTHRLPDTARDWQPLMEHLNGQIQEREIASEIRLGSYLDPQPLQPGRHLNPRDDFKKNRATALAEWRQLTA